MAKGKKGKKKKKDNKEVEPPIGKEFYIDQIAELNKTLAELRKRTFQLETRNIELVEKYDQLVIDRDDVIIYINKMVRSRVEDIGKLKKAATELEELQQQDQEKFEKEIEQLEEEFTLMREQLDGDIKNMDGRLAAMEEYRLEKDELLRKFEIQEDALEEQEERHKRVLYETEKRFILEKEAFSRDMRQKVQKLAFDFEDKNELRIAAVTQRLVKENIAANKKINSQIAKNEELEMENEKLLLYFNKLKQEFRVCKTQCNTVIKNNHIHKELINNLRNQITKLHIKLKKYFGILRKEKKDKEELGKATKRVKEMEDKICILQQNIHVARCKQVTWSEKLNESLNTVKICQEIIHEIKICTKYLDHLQTLGLSHDDLINKRNTVFEVLVNLITETLREPKEAKQMQIPLTESMMYARGDLGFVPKVHQESAISMIFNAISQVGKSLESLLKTPSEVTSSTTSVPMDRETIEEEETVTTIEEESTEGKEFILDNVSDDDEPKGSMDEEFASKHTLVGSSAALQEIMGEGYEAMGEHIKLLEGIGAVAYGDLVYPSEDYE